MTDLAEEVKNSFETQREYHKDEGPVHIIKDEDELAPGFNAMRHNYEGRVVVVLRRGYRHHAGSTMPTDCAELVLHTSGVMIPNLVGAMMLAFVDGVQIGHQDNLVVKMCFHFDTVEHLFHDEDFRESSKKMAIGFAEDPGVLDYFTTYIQGAVEHLCKATGFAHREIDPPKVWDIWMMTGTATVTASYLAGYRLGCSWRERDVLDGIEIASEVNRGSEGEA